MAQDLFLEPVETDMPAQPEPAPAPADDGPPPPSAEAPYGWTADGSGGWRPKKTAGRRKVDEPTKPPAGVSPSLEDLKAQRAAEGPRREDVAPAPPPKRGSNGRFRKGGEKQAPQPSTPFRAGPIAKGINRIYRKAGKIIRVWDPLIGEAVISCTRKEDEDDTTVGEAWEELARVNPRVRAFLERIIQGGAVGGIVAAHMPIVMAVLMKDSIRDRLPLGGLVGAFLDRDEEDGQQPAGGGGLGGLIGEMSPEDMAMVMQMAQGMMGGMMQGMPRDTGAPRQPGDVIPGQVVGTVFDRKTA